MVDGEGMGGEIGQEGSWRSGGGGVGTSDTGMGVLKV